MLRNVSQRFDGAYSLVLLNADGQMVVARDPWELSRSVTRSTVVSLRAASESVALVNLGFKSEQIKSLAPGMPS